MATFLCKQCTKQRPVTPSAAGTNTCIRCKLFYNKVLLLRCFNSITDQQDMKEFRTEMEQWYV